MSCERVLLRALRSGEAVEGTWHVHLEPLPRLVAAARAFVMSHAPPLPDDTVDALLLLTSELVTNAVLHARTPLEIGITVGQQSVLVTVHDLGLTRPEQNPYVKREGGWGLGLVSSLAEASAMEPHSDGGKTAWFRLHRGDLPKVGDAAAARGESDVDTGQVVG